MNIEEKLSKYTDAIEKAIESGTEFTIAQAPEVIREYLAWMFWGSFIVSVISAIVGGVSLVVVYRLSASAKKELSSSEDCVPFSTIWIVVLITVVVCGAKSFCESATTALKVSVAPRLVVLEKLSSLAKGKE